MTNKTFCAIIENTRWSMEDLINKVTKYNDTRAGFLGNIAAGRLTFAWGFVITYMALEASDPEVRLGYAALSDSTMFTLFIGILCMVHRVVRTFTNKKKSN